MTAPPTWPTCGATAVQRWRSSARAKSPPSPTGGGADRASGRARRDVFLRAVATAAAGAGGRESVTIRVASLLEALVSCGFHIGAPTLFMASRVFGRPELYLPSGPILYY